MPQELSRNLSEPEKANIIKRALTRIMGEDSPLISDINKDVDEHFLLDESKHFSRAGKETGEALTRTAVLQNLPEITGLIGELTKAAKQSADVQKMLAECKSLRQEGNKEGRTDLYMSAKPSQTLEGRAAVMLAAIVGFLMDEEESTHVN